MKRCLRLHLLRVKIYLAVYSKAIHLTALGAELLYFPLLL